MESSAARATTRSARAIRASLLLPSLAAIVTKFANSSGGAPSYSSDNQPSGCGTARATARSGGIPSLSSKLTLALACACALVIALTGAATLRAETTRGEPPAEPEVQTPLLKQAERQRLIDR